MFTVEATDEAIHIRIPRGEISEERLTQILSGLRLEAAVAGSQMTDEQAEAMAEEMKADWWERNKARFLPPEALAGE
jgi:hypothetical protein